MHTYSSLNQKFIKEYANTLDYADSAIVFYDPIALKIKNRKPLAPELVKKAFANEALEVHTNNESLNFYLFKKEFINNVLIMMSSGNFGELNWEDLKDHILKF